LHRKSLQLAHRKVVDEIRPMAQEGRQAGSRASSWATVPAFRSPTPRGVACAEHIARQGRIAM